MADADMSKDPEVPLDDEAKKLKLEAIKADARKTIAQAQKDTLAAQFPSTDVKAPEGTIDVGDKVGLVAQAVAYSAMADVAWTIAGAVPDAAAVLIVDDRNLFATDWQYEMVSGDLAQQKAALHEAVKLLAPPRGAEGADVAPLVAGLTVASSLSGGAAQLAGMFRSDYALSALEPKIESTPLIAAVTKCLLVKRHTTVVDGFSLVRDSAVLSAFREAWKQRRELEKRKIEGEQRIAAKAARAEDVRARLKDAATAYDKALAEAKTDTDLTKLQGLLTDMTETLDTLETDLRKPRTDIALAGAVATRFDTFATTVTAVPSGGGYAPIIGAALRERLHGDNPGLTHVLFLSVDTAGAETVTIRGLFRQKARFVGGVHVSYLVLGVEEKIVASGTAGRIRQLNYKLSSGAFKRVDQQDLYGA